MRSVWIDTDMGFDDLVAICMLSGASDVSIEGISLVAGNAELEVVAANADRAATFFGWDVAIYMGRGRPILGCLVTAQYVLGDEGMVSAGRKLPEATISKLMPGAVSKMAEGLEQANAPLTILALGPLTNIAVLCLLRPDLLARIDRLVWMGGSAGSGNHTPAAEFNAAVDPEAVQIVLNAGVPLRMVELVACRQARFDATDARAIRDCGGDHAEVLSDLFAGYIGIGAVRGSDSMPLYDAVAAAALLDPLAVTFRPGHLAIECAGQVTRGMTVIDWRAQATPNVQVSVAVSESLVRKLVLDALTAALVERRVSVPRPRQPLR
jgi:purine nucleosidase